MVAITFYRSTDETTTTWTELGGGSGGTEQLFVGDIALINAAPETFNLGGEVHDGDLLMIVYRFYIQRSCTMVGPKAGRGIILDRRIWHIRCYSGGIRLLERHPQCCPAYPAST